MKDEDELTREEECRRKSSVSNEEDGSKDLIYTKRQGSRSYHRLSCEEKSIADEETDWMERARSLEREIARTEPNLSHQPSETLGGIGVRIGSQRQERIVDPTEADQSKRHECGKVEEHAFLREVCQEFSKNPYEGDVNGVEEDIRERS